MRPPRPIMPLSCTRFCLLPLKLIQPAARTDCRGDERSGWPGYIDRIQNADGSEEVHFSRISLNSGNVSSIASR